MRGPGGILEGMLEPLLEQMLAVGAAREWKQAAGVARE